MKKLLLIIISSFLILNSLLFPFVVNAQANPQSNSTATSSAIPTWYNTDFKDFYGKVYDTGNPSEIFGERYTAAQVQWVVYGLFSFILNSTGNSEVLSCILSSTVDLSACTDKISGLLTSVNTSSKLAATNKNVGFLSLVFATDRPLSGIGYVKEKIQNFSLVPTAKAQTVGFGFTALSAVRDMWKAFRDIAFGLFVLVAVIFAFMIMFRVKLSPQVVISVQSALPKIITALVLVTFSYAIAGFLVDLMYVIIGFLSLVIAPLVPTTWFQTVTYKASDVFNFLTVGPVTQQLGAGTSNAGGIMGLLGLYLTPLVILLLIGLAISLALVAVAPIIAIIVFILIILTIIILLWMTIKIIWALFKALANILLLTIFAPVQIALGTVVPSLGFGQWIKSFISNLSVFVVTGVLATFAWIFVLEAWSLAGPDLTLTASGTTANPWPPLLGSSGVFIPFLGVSFVLFTLIPKATEVIQGLISGRPFAYGSAIGEAITPITAFTQYQANQLARGEGRLPDWLAKIIPLSDRQQKSAQSIAKTYLNLTGKKSG